MMKCIQSFSVLLFLSGGLFGQSFIAVFPDTIAYGEPLAGSALSCWVNDTVTNISGKTLTLDVVRVEDDTATVGWTSAFCFQSCRKPEIDSARCIMAPGETVNMAIHFIISSTPDSGTVLIKLKNADNPSVVVRQRFYGISMFGAGINSRRGISGNVKIYPSPVSRRVDFILDIPKSTGGRNAEASLGIYSIYGNIIYRVNDLKEGKNILNLDLPAGIYPYLLVSAAGVTASGKLVISE